MHLGARKGTSEVSDRRKIGLEATKALLFVVVLAAGMVGVGCTGVVSASKPTDPGTAVIQLNPATVSFGSVQVGKQSNQTITIANTGTASMNVTQATVSNSQFKISGLTLPAAMTSGQSATFTVSVTPSASGAVSGTLTVQGDSGSSPATVNLTATAVASNPQASLSASSVNFGNVAVTTSGSSALTISNSGSADLVISSVTIAGAGFSFSGITTPKTITAGQSAQISLGFKPPAQGAATGTLTISSNDPNNGTLSVPLVGSGTPAPTGTLQANLSSVSFGNVNTGSSSAKQIVLTNTGSAAVQISSVSASGTGFSVNGVTTPATLNAAAQATLNVTFAPTAAGSASGNITVTSNATGSPLTIPVSGAGVQAGLAVSPASFNFGSIVDGLTSSHTFTITNTGTASLTISQVSTGSAGFSVSGITVPSTVAPGGSVSFNGVFAPTTAGSLTGTVSIASNAPSSPSTVAVSGTGVAVTKTLSLSASSLAFGNVNTGTSSTKSETITNTGNTPVQISQIAATGAGYSLSGANAPLTLNPAQGLTFNVVFDPTAAGTANGSVAVTSNATGSPAAITLSGTGVAASHTVGLTWTESGSGISGFNVYRTKTSGSGYVKINAALVATQNYTDSSVQNGTTYFYVTSAVDGSGNESGFSNEASAVIP